MWNRSKKSKKGKKSMSTTSDKVNTIIGEETKLIGNVEQKGSIVVYGHVDGNINTAGSITIGKKGTIEGNLTGENITISGNVRGNIVAKTKMILKKDSSLLGDVKAKKIVIDDGATFEGKCDMSLNKNNKQENTKKTKKTDKKNN